MSFPAPEITDVNRPYWDGLAEGSLQFQYCLECSNSWMPPRERCPSCLSDRVEWQKASGRAKVISWVVFHHAYAPHLADRIPYNVTMIELEEGPRMLTNVLDAPDRKGLAIGTPLILEIEVEAGLSLARFRMDASGVSD